ncbi:uncharacterized protein BT62DRAFT_890845, partial [Guyanagaster necrorhizus]
NKDVSRPIRRFLWKALQKILKIGTFGEKLGPQCAMRGECPHCKVAETMMHILIDCQIKGCATLWSLTQELWEKTGKEWVRPSYGIALGATLVQIKMPEVCVDRGATRLYRILMTEAVRFIWKIRCRRCMQRGDDDPANRTRESKLERTD